MATLPIEGARSIGAPMQAGKPNFMLTGPSQRLDPRVEAFRPDLADVALADRLFASHFAAPMMMACVTPFAAIRSTPDGDQSSEILKDEGFEVLDLSGGWAWGWSAHDHYVGYVRAQDVAIGPAAPAQSDRQSSATSAARNFLGMTYVWGGRGGAGIDCSGLIQRALAADGIAAPRDSDQQRELLGFTIDLMQASAGDLVFFPGHVGILTEGQKLLHATRHHGCVIEEPLADVIDRMRAKHNHGVVEVKRIIQPS